MTGPFELTTMTSAIIGIIGIVANKMSYEIDPKSPSHQPTAMSLKGKLELTQIQAVRAMTTNPGKPHAFEVVKKEGAPRVLAGTSVAETQRWVNELADRLHS